MMKKQLFKLVRKYPHSTLDPDKAKSEALQKFRSEIAISYREWPRCGEHYPNGLPEKCDYQVSTKNSEYVLTLHCPECQKDEKKDRVFGW